MRFILKTFWLSVVSLLLGVPSLRAQPVEALVKSVYGKVEYSAPGTTDFKPVIKGAKLAIGTTVRTGIDGEAIIVAVPGAAIRVSPSTTLILGANDFAMKDEKVTSRKAIIQLKSGTVAALIEHNQRDVTDFQIQTPRGIAAARGTFYAVTVADGEAYVAVKEGKVGLQKLSETK